MARRAEALAAPEIRRAKIERIRILEEKRRRLAQRDLSEYCRQIEIPGVPLGTDPGDEDAFEPRFEIVDGEPVEVYDDPEAAARAANAEEFYPVTVEPAAHHRLLNATLEKVDTGEIRRLMVFEPPGSAKALALDTPIPTPSGWTTMGELRVGDVVFDERGHPCNVTWVSPIWTNRPVYTVRTDCGDEIIADREHEWLVRLSGKPRRPLKGNGRGRPGLVGRDDPASRFKIKETWQLAKRRAKRPMIQRAGAIELPDADLPIDPYLLGVWLGDGTSASLSVTSSEDDQPWMRAEIERLGYETRSRSEPTLFGVIGVRAKFVALGLVNDPAHDTFGRKHIPAAYLRASRAQRLALLQGLVDTDGTVCRREGCTTFCNTNRELAEGVLEIVRTLGVKASLRESRATLNGRDCGPVYHVSFYLKGSARLPRKAALTRDQHRTPNTYIDVVPAGAADTVCIEVDSPSHLFLCGRSMTPTHNSTYGSVVFPTRFMARRPGRNVISVSYASNLATRFGRRCRQITRSENFRRIFRTELQPGDRAANRWSLTNGSTYMAGGILSGITGSRADLLVIDDPFKGPTEARSKTIRDKVWEEYKLSLRTRLKPGGRIVLIMTRWHKDDLAGRILPPEWNGESGWVTARDGERWYVLCLAAQCERDDDPLGRQIGDFLWTEWKPVEEWEQEKKSQGAKSWAALYQQRPSPEQGEIIERAWIRHWAGLPGETPLEFARRLGLRIFQTWDFPQKETATSDFTSGQVWGVKWPDVYLLDRVSGRMSTTQMLDAIRSLSAKWPDTMGVDKFVEEAAAGYSVINLCRNGIPGVCPPLAGIVAVPPKGSKEDRLQATTALWRAGNVWLPPPEVCPWVHDYVECLVSFPDVPHDDDVDATSLALSEAVKMGGSTPIRRKRRIVQDGRAAGAPTPPAIPPPGPDKPLPQVPAAEPPPPEVDAAQGVARADGAPTVVVSTKTGAEVVAPKRRRRGLVLE